MHTKTDSISEIPRPPESGARLRAEIPDTVKDGLHSLMLAASRGDRRAIGAVAIAFLPNLVAVAQSALEQASMAEARSTAPEIVAELLDAMASGDLATRPPAPGEGLEWIERVIARFARRREGAVVAAEVRGRIST